MPRLASANSPTTWWRERILPEPGWIAGYGMLVDVYDLEVPLPYRIAMIAERHQPDDAPNWLVLPRRLRPDDTVVAHLELALKYEGVSLAVLNAFFFVADPELIAAFVRSAPTGKYSRRIWFLYEWLTGRELDVPDLNGRPRSIDVVDSDRQVGLPEGELIRRQRVRNNLPGTRTFCPMVRWTPELRRAASSDLAQTAREIVERIHPDVLGRAAAFLLLEDSRSSFAIEGEKPSRDRTRRWGQVIAEAGSRTLSEDELVRLQRIVIGDDRFVHPGLRTEGGFIGSRDRRTREPLPDHISARADDLSDLVGGLTAYENRTTPSHLDPVVAAAVIAFGFVYIHPFADGNGRIHRWLIHHVLARAGYNPPGVPFPVSAVLLRHLSEYREVLESYSKPLLGSIEWEVTTDLNVRVLNRTADFYRFFDATAHAEFLYRCVAETVSKDLPDEIAFLQAYDRFAEDIKQIVDMPEDTVDLLHRFLHQNGGTLSKRALSKEFAALTEDEVVTIERIYRETHAGRE